jgi:type II secretory pathway pseudopilin PulG
MIDRTGHSRRAGRAAFTLVEMVVVIGIIVVLAVLTVTATGLLAQRSEIKQTENVLRLLDLALGEWETSAERKLSWGERGVPYNDASYDMTNGLPHVYTLTEVLRRIRKSAQVKPIIAQIDTAFVHTFDTSKPAPTWIAPGTPDDPDPNAGQAPSIYNADDLYSDSLGPAPLTGELAILDAWDTPIRVVHPGRLADNFVFGDDLSEADPDGTIFVNDDAPAVGSIDFYGTEMIYGRCDARRVRFVSAGPDGRFGNLDAPETSPEHEAVHDNIHSYALADVHEEP